ncbi:MAG: molybdopterin-dependent oxidoreductase, partial [Planctomycetes bacterium]|nr:molybdopterin-dependent oxidoreductase [Planctomycetota bacterium]
EKLALGNRPDSRQHMKIGVGKDGKIRALSAVTHGTAGISARGAGARNTGIYDVPVVYTEHHDVVTNCGPAAPFRAPGCPQGAFALESTVDMAAWKLGMDPLVFRELNDPNPVRAAQRKIGAERIGWHRRHGAKRPEGPLARGIGYAATTWPDTGSPPAEVTVEITADGRVLAINGAQDIGTGTRTLMAMVAAEELGIPVELVGVRLGDTEDGVGPTSGGSKTAPSLMPAVRTAAYSAKRELLGIAAGVLETAAEDLDVVDGKIRLRRDPKLAVAWQEICAKIPGGKLTGLGRRRPNFAKYQNYVCGCQFAEVEVDLELGLVRPLRIVAVQDCGIALNRLTAESQILGAVIQGVAYALHEERIMDRESGRMVNTDFTSYKIAGSLDLPEIEPILFDVANGSNNIGNLGIGEPPTIPTAAAIANAVFDATGVRCHELPLSPMRMLEALLRREV